FGPDMIESQGDFNRPWIVNLLATEYLPSVGDVHARMQADPPARVADVACGVGWASVAIARGYPNARSTGSTPTSRRSRSREGWPRRRGSTTGCASRSATAPRSVRRVRTTWRW